MKKFYMESIIKKDIAILLMKGSCDAHQVWTFEKELVLHLKKNYCKIILDCQNLNYISSAGQGIIMGYIDLARIKGGDIVLVGCNARIYEEFDLVGFAEIYKFFTNYKTAIDYLKNLKEVILIGMSIQEVFNILGPPKKSSQKNNILLFEYRSIKISITNNKVEQIDYII